MASSQYLAEFEKMPPALVREKVDILAQEIRNKVVSSKNYIPRGERVIYLSNAGCDENDGLSMEKPICTIEKLNSITRDGDTVLFKRGDIFRGSVKVVHENMTFSAYGEGVKPIICGSLKNYADPDLWIPTEYENVYRLAEKLDNVGLIIFNPAYTYGSTDEIYADRAMRGKNDFMELCDLRDDLVFYNDRETGELYLCSHGGNPAERFYDIEIGAKGCVSAVFDGGAPGATFDNLWVLFAGCHGISSGTAKRRTVKNCIFGWIGGAAFGGEKRGDGSWNTTRYGNAVQIYGGCVGFHVENNWMYQIFDTAITHQYGGYSEGDCIQEDVIYRGNLTEGCFWHIEFYNGGREGTKRYVKDVYMTGNSCRYGGWGCTGRYGGAPMFCGAGMCEDVENFVAERNIFCHSPGVLVQFLDEGNRKIVMRNNVYIDPVGARLGRMYGNIYLFDDTAKDTLKNLVHEQEPTVVFMQKPNMNYLKY